MSEKRRKIGVGSVSDKAFDTVNLILMIILLFIFVWPLWFVLIASISNPNEVWNGNVILLPKGITLESYKTLFEYSSLWVGYRNTIIYTVLGTAVNLVMTVFAAYPLSRKDFLPRRFFLILMVITMYFSGGLIPTYLVVRGLGLTNTIWAMIIPGACSVGNVLITRTYFMTSIPGALQDAAELDGANSFQYLTKVVLPLSKPILAVMGLYYAVGHWNDYYSALIYVTDLNKLPLQSFLRDLLLSAKLTAEGAAMDLDASTAAMKQELAQTLKYSAIIVAAVPVLCVYPFIQKYFVKGVMIGSLKE